MILARRICASRAVLDFADALTFLVPNRRVEVAIVIAVVFAGGENATEEVALVIVLDGGGFHSEQRVEHFYLKVKNKVN